MQPRYLPIVIALLSARFIAAQSLYSTDTTALNYFTEIGVDIDSSLAPMYSVVCGWLDTPYNYGGHTKSGTDCSSLVKAVYSETWGIVLAGNSQSLFNEYNNPGEQHQICPGGLVFFAIDGNGISHVGIYLGSGAFVHASVHGGVMISRLEEAYYKRCYAGSVQIVCKIGDDLCRR